MCNKFLGGFGRIFTKLNSKSNKRSFPTKTTKQKVLVDKQGISKHFMSTILTKYFSVANEKLEQKSKLYFEFNSIVKSKIKSALEIMTISCYIIHIPL